MTQLQRALAQIASDLTEMGSPFALIGGLAVSLRAEPRMTRDIDLALGVGDDAAAEGVIRGLLGRGYRVVHQLEHDSTGRLASVRVKPPGQPRYGIVVDLLFASSGIEREVVEAADLLEVLPGLRLPVATREHLVALKLLAGRRLDLVDVETLLPTIEPRGHDLIRSSLEVIAARGFARGKDLRSVYQRVAHPRPGEDEEP
ncbi:nucleotidyl transferase AbiEii/AbiGii toxin family protein [Candidatus Binatia bacterium]|jgi:hypothetical protein|nr:nucleotidyl transferase AbiEii/AbiGii toxin family protein [Candidatus Binatia bacterium]